MSTDRQQLLDSVAKAVSDGAAVNWEEADSAALDPEAREMLRQLRIVAEIADLHRKTADEDAPVNPACLLYTSPSPRDRTRSRMPSSA